LTKIIFAVQMLAQISSPMNMDRQLLGYPMTSFKLQRL